MLKIGCFFLQKYTKFSKKVAFNQCFDAGSFYQLKSSSRSRSQTFILRHKNLKFSGTLADTKAAVVF